MKKKCFKASKEALVVYEILRAHLEGRFPTLKELADYAGCHKGSLSRMPIAKMIRSFIQAQGKADLDLPRGTKFQVEGYGKKQPTWEEAWDENARIPGQYKDEELPD
jgi:hypothetical protein